MSIAPIEAIALNKVGLPETGSASAAPGASFMDAVGREVHDISDSLNVADASARALAAGENVPVHDVMIAMEQAHLKLQLAVEVRNRVLDAYQNLTNMQL